MSPPALITSHKQREESKRGAGAVEAAVDEEQRQRDEVGEDEADDAAEGDAVGPERGREGDVADRADERDHGEQGGDGDVLEDGPDAVAADEDVRPPDVRHVHQRKPATTKPARSSLRSIVRSPDGVPRGQSVVLLVDARVHANSAWRSSSAGASR